MKTKKTLVFAGLTAVSFAIPGLVVKYNQSGKKHALAVQHASLWAADKTADTCQTAFQAIIDAAPKRNAYANGVLDHLHDELYRANKIETGDIEMIFCRLIAMGFDPDLTTLPQTITKTDPQSGKSVVATVATPTESWATTAGYTAKLTITNDGTQFLAMWWTGSGDSSKGYVIQGSNPMQLDAEKRLRYALWDKTTSTQIVKVYGAQFATTFLGSVTGASDSKTGGDNAHFARISYDTSTKAITAQAVEIRAGRSDATAFKCVRTYFTGTIDGSIDGYRPAKGVEETVAETATGGASEISGGGMDGETKITDATTTADHAGTATEGSALATKSFDWSCKDLNGSGATGKPFASDTVSYTTDPSTIFPK